MIYKKGDIVICSDNHTCPSLVIGDRYEVAASTCGWDGSDPERIDVIHKGVYLHYLPHNYFTPINVYREYRLNQLLNEKD